MKAKNIKKNGYYISKSTGRIVKAAGCNEVMFFGKCIRGVDTEPKGMWLAAAYRHMRASDLKVGDCIKHTTPLPEGGSTVKILEYVGPCVLHGEEAAKYTLKDAVFGDISIATPANDRVEVTRLIEECAIPMKFGWKEAPACPHKHVLLDGAEKPQWTDDEIDRIKREYPIDPAVTEEDSSTTVIGVISPGETVTEETVVEMMGNIPSFVEASIQHERKLAGIKLTPEEISILRVWSDVPDEKAVLSIQRIIKDVMENISLLNGYLINPTTVAIAARALASKGLIQDTVDTQKKNATRWLNYRRSSLRWIGLDATKRCVNS